MLFDGLRRDYTRFDERADANPDNPWLGWGHYLAHRLGEARGWSSGIRAGVQRALIILLSGHVEGDIVFYSAMSSALRALDLSCNRTADVLDQMGILLDDRRPCFEDWLDGKLDGITPGIAREVQTRRIPGRTQIRQKGATVTVSPGQRAQGRLRRAW